MTNYDKTIKTLAVSNLQLLRDNVDLELAGKLQAFKKTSSLKGFGIQPQENVVHYVYFLNYVRSQICFPLFSAILSLFCRRMLML